MLKWPNNIYENGKQDSSDNKHNSPFEIHRSFLSWFLIYARASDLFILHEINCLSLINIHKCVHVYVTI